MALPKEVQDALSRVQLLADTESEWADINLADWKTIHAHLLSQAVELADWKNAILRAADDCTAKDAEIKRLDAEIERLNVSWVTRSHDVVIAESRLAAADALLRDALHHRKSDQHSGVEECEPLRRWRALYAAIQSHLSENSRG